MGKQIQTLMTTAVESASLPHCPSQMRVITIMEDVTVSKFQVNISQWTSECFVILMQENTLRNTLSFTAAEFPSSGTIFETSSGRRGFRCDHYYEDGTCYRGPNGGDGCSKRKKREDLVSDFNSSISLPRREKRQTDDVIGCQKPSTNGVDYRGRAAETVDGIPCLKWTEGVINPPSIPSEHNYCRNPTDDPNGVWCNTGPSTTGYCNVPKCDPVFTTRDVSCSEWVGGKAYWKWDYEIPDTCERKFELKTCNIEHRVIQLKVHFRGLMSEGRFD